MHVAEFTGMQIWYVCRCIKCGRNCSQVVVQRFTERHLHGDDSTQQAYLEMSSKENYDCIKLIYSN